MSIKDFINKSNDLNQEGIKALTEFVNKQGGLIKMSPNKDTLYAYIFNEFSEKVEEVSILAVFTINNELYIKITYNDNVYLKGDYKPSIVDPDVYLIDGGMVLINATLYNICENISEHLNE